MYKVNRLYTRYPFAAAAEIIDDSGAQQPSQVTNISFGGCRLITNRQLSMGAKLTVKIHTSTESFEAKATVVHSTATEAGVMFGTISAESLFVLQKWIHDAKAESSLEPIV